MSSTKPPPRTRSGEFQAVKNFYEELKIYDEVTAPMLDKAVERMSEIAKKNSIHVDSEAETPAIPAPPRTPSFVDPDELTPTTPRELDGDQDTHQAPDGKTETTK